MAAKRDEVLAVGAKVDEIESGDCLQAALDASAEVPGFLGEEAGERGCVTPVKVMERILLE